MDDKVMRQLKRAMQPALTDIKVEWGAFTSAQPAPSRLPPLFCGGRMIVYAFIKEDISEDVVITASTAVKPFKATMKIDTKLALKGDMLHKLAAKRLIKDLEEGRSYFHDENGKLLNFKSQDDVKAEIIKLSTSYSVLSVYTAFIAVEKRDNATEVEMVLRKVSAEPKENMVLEEKKKGSPVTASKSKQSTGFLSNMFQRAPAKPQKLASSSGMAKSKKKKRKSRYI